MKKKILFLLLLLVIMKITPSMAQHITTIAIPADATKPVKKTDSTKSVTTTKTYNCDNLDQLKKVDVKKNADGSYIVTLLGAADEPVTSFSFSEFNYTLYTSKLQATLLKLCNDSAKVAGSNVMKTLKSKDVFEEMLTASLAVASDDYTAGTLKINKYIRVYIDTNNSDKLLKRLRLIDMPQKKPGASLPGFLSIFDIQVQFQDGFIENVMIHGKLKGLNTLLKFENNYPIAFSTERNFVRLRNMKLYEKSFFTDTNRYVFLGDLLKFDPNLALNSKDYFPANQIYKADITDSITSKNLLKENTSKLLAIEVFSDLNGISNESPNGLIQIDFSKKLNLWTYRFGKINTNIGFFNYFTPEFTLSKIEDAKKYLILDYYGKSQADASKPNSFATTTDLLRYEEFRIGGKLNLFLFDVPQFKSTLFLNFSAHFGNTLIQDTIRTIASGGSIFTPISSNNLVNYSANNVQLIPEVQWEIYPDSRYGFCVTQQFNRFNLLNPKINQIDSKDRYIDYLKTTPADISNYAFSKWIGVTEIKGFFNPSDNNKIFIRYRYNWDMNNGRNNFHQIQVGITTYLTSTSNPKSK